jgi:hypothetical protein
MILCTQCDSSCVYHKFVMCYSIVSYVTLHRISGAIYVSNCLTVLYLR